MILHGNCLDKLKELEDNSVDSVVTDPPYELGFMGKKWDSSGIAYNVDMWKEVYRVLKPGGHLLSFGGTRTYHRMAVAIEDAGFEIRDMVEWVYGSGFSKCTVWSEGAKRNSDRLNKENDLMVENGWQGWGRGGLKPAHESLCLAQKPFNSVPFYDTIDLEIGELLCQLQSLVITVVRDSKSNQAEPKEVSDIAQWSVGKYTSTQDALFGLMDMLRSESVTSLNLNIVLSWLNILADLSGKMNTFTTEIKTNLTTDLRTLNSMEWGNISQSIIANNGEMNGGLTADVLCANALFNAVLLKLKDIQQHFAQENATYKDVKLDSRINKEPIVLARKPLGEKTVALNVLKYGTGGLNIDECRVGTEDKLQVLHNETNEKDLMGNMKGKDSKGRSIEFVDSGLGRFPANLLHDGSDEVVREFPNSKSGGGGKFKNSMFAGGYELESGESDYNDSGSAARFFKSFLYQAKASKSERTCDGTIDNPHPTIKPLALMKYLIQMVTPPGGTVLDPFAGSGSTLVAAKELGYDFIGIEMTEEYIPIIEARLNAVKNVQETLI